MSIVLGVIAVCLDIAILDTIGMNPDYSADVRWACFTGFLWAMASSSKINGNTTAGQSAGFVLLPLASRVATDLQGF